MSLILLIKNSKCLLSTYSMSGTVLDTEKIQFDQRPCLFLESSHVGHGESHKRTKHRYSDSKQCCNEIMRYDKVPSKFTPIGRKGALKR